MLKQKYNSFKIVIILKIPQIKMEIWHDEFRDISEVVRDWCLKKSII